MSINFKNHRVVFIIFSFIAALGALVAPLMSVSCQAQSGNGTNANDGAGIERLREMTRRSSSSDVLPAESVVANIETEFNGTRAGALARLLRARVRMGQKDFAGAAALLDANSIGKQTVLGDYALFMRGQALEQAGKRVEARAAFEKLTRDFPASIRVRESILRSGQLALAENQGAAVPLLVKVLTEKDDAAALLLAAKGYEQGSDTTRALSFYRRLYFYVPASKESAEAAAAITRLKSTTSPATAEEAITRADKLFEAKLYTQAVDAYLDALGRFPQTSNTQSQLRRGIAASNARRFADAVAALVAVPPAAGEMRAEALYNLALTYARQRQWQMVQSTLDGMQREFPKNSWTLRAMVASGQAAKDAKDVFIANNFFRAAMNAFPGEAEVAGAQFEVAWAAHEAKNFQESSRLLIEHLAQYADKNTDNRGRAGYWAARDCERAGRIDEARALYQAMLERYSANWYGYLSKQRLDVMKRNSSKAATTEKSFAPESSVGLAIAHLRPVTIADETAGPEAEERITKADQLAITGLDDWAHEELDQALETAPTSPRLNLAKARIHRARNENLEAFNVLRRSFPDYSQMRPEEMTREEWDVFYPLAHWEIITTEAGAKNLDPYMVAGLIRQESVFNPRAISRANAYGLMQLLISTGRLVAKRYGIERQVTSESLFEPRLNIQLGTGYLRDNLDKFGRLEYVAAAYNAGPGRAVQWRETLPLEIDEWAEAIPFRETRGYVQGVVRNMLQYKRLYDEQGRFRPEVGTRATRTTKTSDIATPKPDENNSVRPRRVSSNEEE